MDELEKICTNLGRRDEALRASVRAVLSALRELRTYSDTLYDQQYDLRESVEELQKAVFRADEDTDTPSPALVAPPTSTHVEASAPDAARPSDTPAPVPAAVVVAAPQVAAAEPAPAPVPAVLLSRVDNVGVADDDDPIAGLMDELDEATTHNQERFHSIQRRDDEMKKKVRRVLAGKTAARPARPPIS